MLIIATLFFNSCVSDCKNANCEVSKVQNQRKVVKKHLQGKLIILGGDLDLAINGKGFFEVVLPDGRSAYTRNGNFHLNSEGNIVNEFGYKLKGLPAISTKVNKVDITLDGTVSASAQGNVIEVGDINLCRFGQEAYLEDVGHDLYVSTSKSGMPIYGIPGHGEFGEIWQGFLEAIEVLTVIREVKTVRK